MISINTLFEGRYWVERYIGRGGMADVYYAKDNVSKGYVAIKIVREDEQNKEEMFSRFAYEIRIAAAIQNHFNIVQIYDFGKTSKGLPYMVTEFIQGQTLKDALDIRKTFPFMEACLIMKQLLDALNEIHTHNIVHRDVKPQNIYLCPDSTIKLADFGISLFLNHAGPINEKNKIVGTPQYISPESIRGEKPSILNDIYSAGITFYELIAGTVPFDNENPNEILKMVLDKPLPDILQYRSSVPEELWNVIQKACAKDKTKRYQSAIEFKDAIEDLLKNKKKLKSQNWFERFFGLKGK